MPIRASDFASVLITEFPELRADVEDELNRGLVHLEMAAFAEFVQLAKGRADWEAYGRAMDFADRLLREADADLDNALHVSFLEHIDFDGPNGQRAWAFLSAPLQRGWRQINDGWGRPRPKWMK
jgi:hypothetical protein